MKGALRTTIVIAALAAPISHVCAGALNTAMRTITAQNPRVIAQRYSEIYQQQRLQQTYSELLPTISVTSEVGSQRSYQSDSTIDILNRKEYGLELNQVFYSGFSTGYSIKQNMANEQMSEHQYDELMQQVAQQLATSYLNIYRWQQTIYTYQKSVQVHLKMLSYVRKKLSGGAGKKSEIELVSSRLSMVRASLISAQRNLATAKNTFYQLTNTTPPTVSNWPKTPKITPNKKQWQKLAQQSNPRILTQEDALLSSKAGIGIARAKFMPTISASLTYKKGENVAGIQDTDKKTEALLKLEYDFFTGGSDLSALHQSQTLYQRARYTLADTRRLIRNLTESTLDKIYYNKQRLYQLRMHRKYARQVWHSYMKEYKAGKRDLFETLLVEADYYNAYIQLLSTRYDWEIEHYNLLALTNKLSSFLTESPSRN